MASCPDSSGQTLPLPCRCLAFLGFFFYARLGFGLVFAVALIAGVRVIFDLLVPMTVKVGLVATSLF
jgi:hypothetical protein